jgi:hypothetical protein
VSKRGTKPPSFLFLPHVKSTSPFMERDKKGELKRGFASLIKLIPLPLDKGKGIKGIGFINIKGVRCRKLRCH